MGMSEAWLLPLLPAGAFVILLIFGPWLPRRGDFIAVGAMLATLILVLVIIADFTSALAAQGAEFPAPHAGGDDQGIASDDAAVGDHGAHPVALDLEAGLWDHISLGSSFVGSAPSSLNRPHTAGSGHGRSKINSCLNRCLKN